MLEDEKIKYQYDAEKLRIGVAVMMATHDLLNETSHNPLIDKTHTAQVGKNYCELLLPINIIEKLLNLNNIIMEEANFLPQPNK